MAIRGLTEIRRLPRVGKIHLGVKLTKQYPNGKKVDYPSATPYFVCPPEVQKVYGEKPTKLDILIPVEDDELWCSQYYRQYSNVRGLVCKGDGTTCRRMMDADNPGNIASRESTTVKWEEGIECKGRDCPDYQRKACQEVMNLQVLLPKVPGLGIWQIDTGSINSIRNINDMATLIRATVGQISFVPLTLSLEPTEVVNPDDGRKKLVYCLFLRTDKGFAELLQVKNQPRELLFINTPAEDEAPRDKQLAAGNGDNTEELQAAAEDDIESLYGVDQQPYYEEEVKPKLNEPTATETLLLNVIDRIPNLRTIQSARSYLKYVQKIPEERIDREPDKVWEEVKGKLGTVQGLGR